MGQATTQVCLLILFTQIDSLPHTFSDLPFLGFFRRPFGALAVVLSL